MCKTPELAGEVALGPIKEFDYDVAILFSDILFALEGLGMNLRFDPGPKFQFLINEKNVEQFTDIDKAIHFLSFQNLRVLYVELVLVFSY